jgi:hypothetical protein
MREARYPLAAARTQRDLARQTAELELRNARAAHQDAAQAVEAAAARVAEHARQRTAAMCAAPLRSEGARLAQSGAYAARLRAQGARLAQQLRAAQAILAERARAVRLAELTWMQAHAEREAIERHHERFREAERKAAERKYELELEERSTRPQ